MCICYDKEFTRNKENLRRQIAWLRKLQLRFVIWLEFTCQGELAFTGQKNVSILESI